jgi:AhpD family alkylhydroperoxidase
MTREEVYKEVEEMCGFVPSFIKALSEDTLVPEWELFKRMEIDEGRIPLKYRSLIGLGIAAAEGCRYCVYADTVFARLAGATDEEIEEALHYAKHSSGWITYLEGLQPDFDEFRSEIDRIVEHVREMERRRAA